MLEPEKPRGGQKSNQGNRGGSRGQGKAGGQGGQGGGRRGGKEKKWAKLDTEKITPWVKKETIAPQPLVLDKPSSFLNPNAPVFTPKKPGSSPQSVQQQSPSGEVRKRGSKHRYNEAPRFEERADHLLNFTYARREEAPVRRFASGRPTVQFTKERFLQANYRFVVNAAHTYLKNLYEADLIVEWENIEQVIMFNHGSYQCPICWDPLRAAKMTKCGHIFCWACILRYLGMTTRAFRKCPICIESVSGGQLKSAIVECRKQIKEEQVASFVLMKRAKACMVALPEPHWRELDNFLLYSDEDARFSRFVRIPDITSILDQEQLELNEAHASAVASGEIDSIPAIELAQHNLDERRVAARATQPEVSKKPQVVGMAEEPDNEPVKDVWADGDDVKSEPMSPSPRAVVVPPSQALSTPPSENTPQPEPKETKEPAPSAKPTPQSKTSGKGKNEVGETHYYFYQSADGQHIFLQPLAFRCLLKEYGSVEQLPKQVEAKIEFMEEITLSEATRKRWKKIVGHLPLSTAFQFCDIDLNGLISQETLTAFASELEWRKAKREKKRKERGEGSVQRKPPEPSSWEAEYSELPAEVRMALTEEEVKEAVNLERGEKEEKREKEEPQKGEQTKPKPAAPRKDQQDASAAKASPPAVPSFLQVLSNTASVPSKAGPKGAPGKGKGNKKGQQQVFSNNSSRRY